jgi:hypothetical protein
VRLRGSPGDRFGASPEVHPSLVFHRCRARAPSRSDLRRLTCDRRGVARRDERRPPWRSGPLPVHRRSE